MTGAELKKWRGEHTQAECAGWVGVNVRTWRRWEAGQRRIPRWLEQHPIMKPLALRRRSPHINPRVNSSLA